MPSSRVGVRSCTYLMNAMPATALSWGSSRFSSRPTSSEANSPVIGMTCIAPTALPGETEAMRKRDSVYAWPRARRGSTPIRSAVSRTICCICSGVGCGTERSRRRFSFAEAVTCGA